MRPTSSGARAPRQLLLHDEVLGRAEAPAAVGHGPCHRHPARAGKVRLPTAPEGDFVAQVVEARGQTHPVLPWQVVAEPLPQLPAELLLFGRRRQVHRPEPA